MSARHVLVTGAAGGIGAACVDAFAAVGDDVTGLDAREEELVAAMERTGTTHGVRTRSLVVDLAEAGCGSAVARAAEELGPVDVLVNAAGIYPANPLAEMTADVWDRVQHVNVRAPVMLTVAMASQGRPGAVVNVSSGAATRARPGAAHYCTSKAALEMATRSCAVELAAAEIRVNAVAPGFVRVDSPVNPVTDDYRTAVSRNPLGRSGEPEEIASAVVWLASEASSFVTGSVLRVDGGATAGTADLPLHHPTTTSLQEGAAS